jgi:hypothetical protein
MYTIFRGQLAGSVLLLCLLVGSRPGDSRSAEDGSAAPAGKSAPDGSPDATIDPLSVNAGCYVCHLTFVHEDISRVHFAEKVTCVECHGLSAAHANDEDVGATKPDIAYRRDQVDAMCAECHETHDVPARDVIARFVERKIAAKAAVCTDCHGHHRIQSPTEE